MQVPDTVGWAREQVDVLVELNAVLPDELSKDALGAVLVQLVESPRPEGFSWRYALFTALQVAPLAVEVGFAPVVASEDEAWDGLLMVHEESSAGQHVADFELNGAKGRHSLAFSFRDPETLEMRDSGELWVRAGVVTRRRLGPEDVDVVAAVYTPHVEIVLGSLLTLYDLVSGDEIVQDYEASISHT